MSRPRSFVTSARIAGLSSTTSTRSRANSVIATPSDDPVDGLGQFHQIEGFRKKTTSPRRMVLHRARRGGHDDRSGQHVRALATESLDDLEPIGIRELHVEQYRLIRLRRDAV